MSTFFLVLILRIQVLTALSLAVVIMECISVLSRPLLHVSDQRL